MTPTTPMALDEVSLHEAIAIMDHSASRTTPNAQTRAWEVIRDRLAALQSAHAEEVAGLREELNDQCRLLASGVERELNFQLRAEQAEARLARVEADAKVLAYALSDNVAPHHLSHDVKCAIRKYVATTPTAGESHD